MWSAPSPASGVHTGRPRRHLPGHNRVAGETGPQFLAFAACDAYSLRTSPLSYTTGYAGLATFSWADNRIEDGTNREK